MKAIKKYGRATVAGILLLAVVVGMVFLVYPVKAEPVDTYHSSWHLVRETADEDGASFAAVYDLTGVGTTNGHFADKDSSTVANGGPFHIVSRPIRMQTGQYAEGISAGGKWMFAICGKNYNNTDDTASFNVVGWSKTNGMLQNICEGSIVLGTQAVVVYPDGGDALGELINETGVTYTHATKTFTDTGDTGAFDGAAVGMLARVTGTNITDAIVQVTTVTDANIIICSGVTSTDNTTDATVQINPAFWADTITLDETTKWSGSCDPNTNTQIAVWNSGDNEVALLVIDTTGLEWIQFVFYDCDAATGDEAGDITVFGRRY